MLRLLMVLLLGVVSLVSASPASFAASAGDWPSKPVTIIVPWGAGGGLDAAARMFAKYWEPELGVPVLVVNRPGAGCLMGTSYFVRQPDDGYTVLMQVQPHFSSSIVIQKAPYRFEDLAVLDYMESEPFCLALPKNAPYKTFEELNAAVRSNPGKLRMASLGVGNPSTIFIDALIRHYGWDVKLVDYANTAERMAALMGGHLDIDVSGLLTAMNNEENILMVWSDRRMEGFEDIPTLNEMIQDVVPMMSNTRFLAVHASLAERHPDRYRVLLESTLRARQNPEYLRVLKEGGRDIIALSMTTEEGTALNRHLHEAVLRNRDKLAGQ